MRGSYRGALSRTYLHSGITEVLWRDVVEIDTLFQAKLSHAMMVAAMYGNDSADLEDGNDKIHEMYLRALRTIPYIGVATANQKSSTSEMVEEWKRLNADAAAKEADNG